MWNSTQDRRLFGVWLAPDGMMQLNPDGTAMIDGQWFRYTADGNTLTVTGTRAAIPIPYRLDGDTLTYAASGRTMSARRVPPQALAAVAQAMQRGAGVWAGSESSLDPGLYISWTQYLFLYPDGSVDQAQTDSGASQQQVSAYTSSFFYSSERSPMRRGMGRWQGDGMSVVVQWNNGMVWQGQLDAAAGRLVFFGIGRMQQGANVEFERQVPRYLLQAPGPGMPDQQAPQQAWPPTASAFEEQKPEAEDDDLTQVRDLRGSAGDPLSRLKAALTKAQRSGRMDRAEANELAAVLGDPNRLAVLLANPALVEALTEELESTGEDDIESGEEDSPIRSLR